MAIASTGTPVNTVKKMTDADSSPPDLSLSPSGRELIIPGTRPAKEDGDVFISVSETVANVKKLVAQAKEKRDNVVFIRARVASGKTTLASHLTTKHSDEFLEVLAATSEDMWYQNVINASGKTGLQIKDILEALTAIGTQGKTIVIDEAHLMFSHPNVIFHFFKNNIRNRPTFLLFSASGSAEDTQATHAPAEIRRKYLWYPPSPDAEKLKADLAEAKQPVHLDVESVHFFVNLCGGHRGILMVALEWVQERQNNDPGNDSHKLTRWSIEDSVSEVRATFEDSELKGGALGWTVGLRKALTASQAVRVNGNFSEVTNIPKEFGLVLFGGPKFSRELKNEERCLTSNGFLFPEHQDTNEEFVRFDWLSSEVSYAVPNPMMAEYYADSLPIETNCKCKLVENKKKPSCAADLLARVLPYMTFTTVVGNPFSRNDGTLSNCLSKKGLPFEEEYNGAIKKIMKDNLQYSVSEPKDGGLGKMDVVITYDDKTTCAIESVMDVVGPAKHKEHAERFLNPKTPNYSQADQKVLLIIGQDEKSVKGHVQLVAEAMKGKDGAPEIVGIRVSLHHNSYEMYLRGEAESIFFVCDRVAKSLKKDVYGRLETAQLCVFESAEGAQKKPRPST